MKKIGLIDVDGKNFPNLALMKIAAYYKKIGYHVEWYSIFSNYEIVFLSKIFTFTQDYQYIITNAEKVEKGGTGYNFSKKLPSEIDLMQPDYSIYSNIVDNKTAYGFLTRGCIRNCKWCIVPKKEGILVPYMDIEEIAIENRNKIILMDNNILASDYGINQIEKIIKLKLHVDFNQDLDCRLVNNEVAKMLVNVKWIKYIRFACDTSAQLPYLFRACDLLKKNGYNGSVFMNVLLSNDFNECLYRISKIKEYKTLRLEPFAQPYIDFSGIKKIPQWQKDLARYVNRKEIFFSTDFKDYKPRKNFTCNKYFSENI
jgi:hypothetical protein